MGEDIKKTENLSDENLSKTQEPKRKRKKWLIVLISVLCVLLVVIGIPAGIAVYFVKSNMKYKYNPITEVPEELGFQEVRDERIINMALFGLDTRNPESFSGRSDAIMILSVNTGTGKVKLISVMRDSFVPIDKESGRVYSKINSAYASGGPVLAIKTLNTIFDLDISEYVSVNLFKLKDIIDVVGGIEVEVTANEVEYLNGGVRDMCEILEIDPAPYLVKKSGKQHLDGVQATSYARIRYTSNAEGTRDDYGRTDRQRYIMEQMFKKVVVMEKSKYVKLVKPIFASCESSLSYSEIFEVAIDVMSMNPTLGETRVPEYSYLMTSPKTSAGSVVYYDLNFAAKLIHAFIYDDITPNAYINKNGVEKNNWYLKGFKPPKIEHEDDKKDTAENETGKSQAVTESKGSKK